MSHAGTALHIVPLTSADIEAVARLARIVWQDAYPGIITQAQIDYMLAQRYAAARLHEELATPGLWWDQARLDGRLAGFAATQLTDMPGEMKLDKLYVDPALQRAGVGGALIAHVAARARTEGCDLLILAVNKRNVRAIGAYRKHGFAVRESVRVDIGGGFAMDDFIMVKSLNS